MVGTFAVLFEGENVMLTKRLEILFDPKEFETVKKKAEAEGKSIACMIRETLREKIIESDSNHGNRL